MARQLGKEVGQRDGRSSCHTSRILEIQMYWDAIERGLTAGLSAARTSHGRTCRAALELLLAFGLRGIAQRTTEL